MSLKKYALSLTEVEVLHNPDFQNTAHDYIKQVNLKTASLKFANKSDSETEFDLKAEIEAHPDSLFVKSFAIKANETNDNGDWFSRAELKKAVATFVGKPVFTNHQNTDIEKAKGKIVHSWYDDEKDGIMVIMMIDATAYPQLARGIKEGYMASTSMGCFLGDNRVLMADGTYCPIQDVQPGDQVITHKGNIKSVKNVQRHIDKENDYILHLDIRGISDTIDVTKDHPFWTIKNTNICACGCGEKLSTTYNKKDWVKRNKTKLIPGHYQKISNYTKGESNYEFEWKKAEDLRPGDVLCLPRLKANKKLLTQRQAKLIGIFLSEGSYLKYKGERKAIEFNFNINEKDTLAELCCELLRKEFGKINQPRKYIRTDKNLCVVQLSGEKIAKWFFKMCGEYAQNKKLHPDILQADHKTLKIIIGHFIGGDGYVHKSETLTDNFVITTSSKDLRDQFSTIITKLGFSHSTSVVHDKKTITLRKAAGAEPACEYSVSLGRSFNRVPSYRLQIGSRSSAEFNSVTPFKDIKKKAIRNNRNSTNDYVFTIINSISSSYNKEPVYTLEVEDDHSYVVEGIAVQNCKVRYSCCSICHNYATVPNQYCSCVKERKTRKVSGKFECKYHENGEEEECPLCGCKKGEKKSFVVKDAEVHEKNFGIEFIENSCVAQPACHSCGITEVIDSSKLLKKVASLKECLPGLLKSASTHNIMCTDQSCVTYISNEDAESILNTLKTVEMLGSNLVKIASVIKIAGQKEMEDLQTAMDLITGVCKSMLDQKDQIDMEFLSELTEVLSDLQAVKVELDQQGFGRLPPAEGQPTALPGSSDAVSGVGAPSSIQQAPSSPAPTSSGSSKVNTGPAGQVGTVTGPLANSLKNIKVAASTLKLPLKMNKTSNIKLNSFGKK